MGDSKLSTNERISALVDNDLRDEDLALVFNELLGDPESIRSWHTYQVIGDVLRSPELSPSGGDFAFLERLERRLALETTLPRHAFDGDRLSPIGLTQLDQPIKEHMASNASVFRWKALAGLSCMALAGVLSFNLWMPSNQGLVANVASVRPDVPVVSNVIAVETQTGPMLRDPRLDELMAAHRQMGGHSALQVPAGFLRNATYEGAGR